MMVGYGRGKNGEILRRSVSVEGFEAVPNDNNGAVFPRRAGFLPVTCWCEARYFYVPEAWVGRGKTASCGPGCEETVCG
jgi:hypothetical protein